MTARHAFTGQRPIRVCDDRLHPGCRALVWADGPLEGQDVDTDHQPKHSSIPGYPYVVWLWGVQVFPDTEADLRGSHDTRFPITGGLCDGERLGGRW
jgi:hypothetical protein